MTQYLGSSKKKGPHRNEIPYLWRCHREHPPVRPPTTTIQLCRSSFKETLVVLSDHPSSVSRGYYNHVLDLGVGITKQNLQTGMLND